MAQPLWIAPGDWRDDAAPLTDCPFIFRKEVSLPAEPERTEVEISASWKYVLFVNGRRVMAGPARGYPAQQAADRVDLAPYLRAGANVLTVVVLPCTGVLAYSVMVRAGLWLNGEVRTDQGSIPLFSDGSWASRPLQTVRFDGGLTSLPTGFQEHWTFNSSESAWTVEPLPPKAGVRVLGPRGTPPWHTLEPRAIPLLVESPLSPQTLWGGRVAGSARLDNATPRLRAREFNGSLLEGAGEGTLRFDEVLELQQDSVVTLDLRRTRLIRPGFVIEDSAGGACRVELYYDIRFKGRPSASLGFGHQREGFGDSVTIPDGASGEWGALQTRGCRYVTIRLAGAGRVRLRLRIAAVDYPFPALRPSPHADPLLTQIWTISAETLRSSTNDAIVDTCSRENVLWTLDACVSARAAFHLFGETAMWRRCLVLIGQGVEPNGIPHAVVPSGETGTVLFDQSLYWVVSCRDYVELTGDRTLAEELAPALTRFLSLCRERLTSEDLFVPPTWSWHWVDWAPIPKDAYSLPINALLLLAADAAVGLASRGGGEALSKLGTSIATRLRRALPRFFDETKGAFANRIDPTVPTDPDTTFMLPGETIPFGLHANGLALRAGVGSAEQRRRAAAFMVECLNQPRGPINEFGPGWTEIILAPLCDAGHGNAALRFVRQVYGEWIEKGEPTWHERFGHADANTAHGWGASVATLLVHESLARRF